MVETVERKCNKCKQPIVIDKNDINEVVLFKELYYHEDCFRALAAEKAANPRTSPEWKKALDDNLVQVKQAAIQAINYKIGHDMLWDHLLASYNINMVTKYISKTTEQVVNGTYKGKSNPIPYRDFATCWIESQPDLNRIAMKNEHLGKKMAGDQRINYDMAIVVRYYPEWKKAKEKAEQHKKEIINSVVFEEIDMSRIGRNKQNKKRDMSDVADYLFVE